MSFDQYREDMIRAIAALNLISNIKHGIESTRQQIMDSYEAQGGKDEHNFYSRLRDEVMMRSIPNEDLASSIARLSIMLFEAEDARNARKKDI